MAEKSTKIGRSPQELLAAAYGNLPAHEQQPTHPSAVCYNLLLKAPEEMLTVLVTCLRASRECGLPPAVGNAPAKSLIRSAFEVYCTDRDPPGPKDEATKKADFETWQETSEILSKMIVLLFDKAKEAYAGADESKQA